MFGKKKKEVKPEVVTSHSISRRVEVKTVVPMHRGEELHIEFDHSQSGEMLAFRKYDDGYMQDSIYFYNATLEEVELVASRLMGLVAAARREMQVMKTVCVQCKVQKREVDGDYCLACGKELA